MNIHCNFEHFCDLDFDYNRVIQSFKKIVNWCFEPSQPQGIISGLKETFIKRYIVEMTDKAELRPQERSESCRENLRNKIQLGSA